MPIALGLASATVFVALVFYLLNVHKSVDHANRVIADGAVAYRLMIDAESGLRGYALTGVESFMDPFVAASHDLPAKLEALKDGVKDDPDQISRVNEIEVLYAGWRDFSDDVRERRANRRDYQSPILAGHGRNIMDAIRRKYDQVISTEVQLRDQRTVDAARISRSSIVAIIALNLISGAWLAIFGRRQLRALADRFGSAMRAQGEQNAALARQQWVTLAKSEIARRIGGERPPDEIGRIALDYLGAYTGAAAGVFYVREPDDTLRRIASFATRDEAAPGSVKIGQSLVGECARVNRVAAITDLPPGYLNIGSGLGAADPAALLLAPLSTSDFVQGVIELGFLNAPPEGADELFTRISELIALALQSSRYRQQLERLLHEQQNQAEELQSQQEELRVTNEELEEQARMLKDSQTRIELQNAELARASQYKSDFLANMSHELRTPLNSSLILAKLLADNKDGRLSEQQVQFAQQILASGHDLLVLINDILDLAKVEAGKLDVRVDDIALDEVVATLARAFRPLAGQKNLALVIEPPPPDVPKMRTDRLRLEQILKNLLSNAIKFSREGEVRLEVTHSAGARRVTFAVRDTGIGIAPEQQDLIFDAFQQADGNVNRRFGGTGLGLSISRQLAKLLGGTLTVASQPGRGSVFTLELPDRLSGPTAGVAPIPIASPPAPASRSTRQRRVVLIIEDDVPFASILAEQAREQKFDPVVAHTAARGLELAFGELPDAVVLDVNLPDHSGLTVLERLKHDGRTRDIPVHVVSGGDHDESALEMGAIGYAKKPLDHAALKLTFELLARKAGRGIHHVLAVGHDANEREALNCLLSLNDVRIQSVATAAEALIQLRANSFDCMIMDLNLPDADGIELLERMHEAGQASHPPVIIYTARALTEGEEDRLRRYSRSVIVKGDGGPGRLLDEVTLFLHRVDAKLAPERQRPHEDLRHRDRNFEGKRLLLVDDDMRNVFALTAVLEQRGAGVAIAKNGREALDKLEAGEAVDLVLMDVMMPVMDGLETTRRIRQNHRLRHLPVIALTAKAMRDDREKCLEAGANDYLAKPVDVEKLLSLVRVWLSHAGGR